MKSTTLTYHDTFPWSPISGWAGARCYGWVRVKTESGQTKRRPQQVDHPFLTQRKKWCMLSIHFNGIDLRFSLPQELDQFTDLMSAKVIPSGRSLLPNQRLGRPNGHWISRLPKAAKPWKYRQAICAYIAQNKDVETFRAFYKATPIQFEFDGIFDSYSEAYGYKIQS